MTEIINKTSVFVKTNMKWIIVVSFGIVMLYFNSLYQSKLDAKITEKRIDKLEMEFLLYKQETELKFQSIEKDNKTHDERLSKKIKILNDHEKLINNNENNIIRLQERK